MRRIVFASFALALSAPAFGGQPMGWNSWDSYGLTVTAAEYRANATVLAEQLRSHGWEYAVVDEGWYLKNPEAKADQFEYVLDGNGRYAPAPNRFPEGLSGLAGWAHSRHLKFGIHIIRGIPRRAVDGNLSIAGTGFHAADAADKSDVCEWNSDNYGLKANAAGQAYYDSLAALYASWGVDLVKVDCIARPYKDDEVRMFSEALRKTGRPIVLSLSPGPAPLEKLAEMRKYATMWRISDDIWDHWKQWPEKERSWSQGILGQFGLAGKWAQYVEPGHWPDADMLPLGLIGPRPGLGKARESDLTHDEERTLVTLWCIFRSPLIMGGNLTKLDSFTTSLLTNDEVLAMDQHAAGSHPLMSDAKQAVWVSRPEAGSGMYVAVFNLDDAPQTISVPLQSLGGQVSYRVRDLWEKKDLGAMDLIRATLAPHAAAAYRLE